MPHQDISQRPYLVRALHEWMTDNGKTPHLVLDATVSGLQVPPEHIQDGKIVLNCSYSATRNLVLGNDDIEFETRFNGKAHLIRAPMESVLGIYARETGEGMLFAEQDAEGNQPTPPAAGDDDNPEPPPAGPGRARLRIVK
ncbi:MAG: ClpXP protease specificity-enhancing factor [Gammaproteobacteria bacterium]|jgi:stringent starvation protein B|nr:ClpXP protease specificity-enhancing factor [Chromatiales bacterium]MDP6673274.1 ClpXP protease specificity-enhancing factor [Gammaproteobacteria bacterium]